MFLLRVLSIQLFAVLSSTMHFRPLPPWNPIVPLIHCCSGVPFRIYPFLPCIISSSLLMSIYVYLSLHLCFYVLHLHSSLCLFIHIYPFPYITTLSFTLLRHSASELVLPSFEAFHPVLKRLTFCSLRRCNGLLIVLQTFWGYFCLFLSLSAYCSYSLNPYSLSSWTSTIPKYIFLLPFSILFSCIQPTAHPLPRYVSLLNNYVIITLYLSSNLGTIVGPVFLAFRKGSLSFKTTISFPPP